MSPVFEVPLSDPPGLDLARRGTPEASWLNALDRLGAYRMPVGRRFVVLAPHPDDETFGVGGIISMLLTAGEDVVVVSVTDGEAASNERRLASRRHQELQQSLLHLGEGLQVDLHRWRLPDSQVARNRAVLVEQMSSLLCHGDVVLAPLDCDGHADHDAIGEAAREVAASIGAEHWFYPIWAWHWHHPDSSTIIANGVRVHLSARAIEAKRRAVQCYVSQISGVDPVVPGDMIERFARSFEVLVRP